MGRKLSLLFVMLASAVILAHSVVPHRHRCFAHETSCTHCHNIPSPSHSHGDDAPCGSEECQLHDSAIGAYRMVKDNNAVLVPASADTDLHLSFFCLCACAVASRAAFIPASEEYPPYIPGFHLRHIKECIGLRAPPCKF